MENISHSALLPYTAIEMFELVNDITAYQHFLPWCLQSDILKADDHQVEAQLAIGQGFVKQAFTTRNTLHFPTQIDLNLIEGPFKSLSGQWQFTQLGDKGCKILLTLNFEFENHFFQSAFAKVFHKLSHALVNAFCERAETIYGKRSLY